MTGFKERDTDLKLRTSRSPLVAKQPCHERPDSVAIVQMIESARQVVNSVIDEIGLQTIELLLVSGAEQVADPRTQG